MVGPKKTEMLTEGCSKKSENIESIQLENNGERLKERIITVKLLTKF